MELFSFALGINKKERYSRKWPYLFLFAFGLELVLAGFFIEVGPAGS